MKKTILGILAFLFAVSVHAGVVFKMGDIVGDDNGPGTYTYPTDKVFEKGAFDLESFEIAENGNYYDFTFTIPIDFKNNWGNVNGWDVQMFDIYLKTDKGSHHQTIAGRNVRIKEGWDKAIVVSPADNKLMWEREIKPKNDAVSDDVTDTENLLTDIVIPDESRTAKNILTARVKKERLPDLSNLKGVQVFVTGSEGYPDKGNSYNRVVNKENGVWRFGGGEDFYGDPNVMDILGSNEKLANYISTDEKCVFTEVSMVMNETTKASTKVVTKVVEEVPVKETVVETKNVSQSITPAAVKTVETEKSTEKTDTKKTIKKNTKKASGKTPNGK